MMSISHKKLKCLILFQYSVTMYINILSTKFRLVVPEHMKSTHTIRERFIKKICSLCQILKSKRDFQCQYRKRGEDLLMFQKTKDPSKSSLNPTRKHSKETTCRISEVLSSEVFLRTETHGRFQLWSIVKRSTQEHFLLKNKQPNFMTKLLYSTRELKQRQITHTQKHKLYKF